MAKSRGRIISRGMLRADTPVEDYRKDYGLFVKREDLSCPPPGPPFSKTRGVYAHIESRKEDVIGVLDTYHSQAGHAVARACQILGKACVNYYPVYKREGTLKTHKVRPPQIQSSELGSKLVPLQAGRSCILFHQARKETEKRGGYMMPNALKLDESVSETAKEVPEEHFDLIIIPASSGTIASGVIRGVCARLDYPTKFVIHLGYSRPKDAVVKYLHNKSDFDVSDDLLIVDEDYAYKDVAREGPSPPFPCNEYYDLKAFRWWMANSYARRRYKNKRVLFWNIG